MQAVERLPQCSSSARPLVSFSLRSQLHRRHRLDKTEPLQAFFKISSKILSKYIYAPLRQLQASRQQHNK